MMDEPVADTAPNGANVWNSENAAGISAGPGNPPESSCEAEAKLNALTVALEAARAELARAGKGREDALAWVRELEAAVREREAVITELRAALRERDRRIGELGERLERTQARITEVEHSLARTVELQRSLEAEFDQARRAQDQTASVLAATRDATDRVQAVLAERDALIRQLQLEVARRGAPGTPAAVGTALADLFKAAKQRRLQRLAVSEPWRLPPSARR